MKVKFAVQAITWGNITEQDLPKVFSEMQDAGYAGVELGWRMIKQVPVQALKQYLADYALTLIATHIGGNLLDSAQASGESAELDEIIMYLSEAGVKRIMFSGFRYKTNEDLNDNLTADLEKFSAIVKKCKKNGIGLNYHNHNWEFENNGLIWEKLMRIADINYCPDVGWVYRGNQDFISELEKIKSKINMIHLKDFQLKPGHDAKTVPVGQGNVPMAIAADWINTNMHYFSVDDAVLWLVSEQDQPVSTPGQDVKISADFLREHF